MLVMSLSLCWAHAIRRSSKTTEIIVFPRRGSHFRGSIVPKPQGEKEPRHPPRSPPVVPGDHPGSSGLLRLPTRTVLGTLWLRFVRVVPAIPGQTLTKL